MLLDIKLGLAWTLIVAVLFGKTITPEWLIAGVVFALLPDIDFWLEYIKGGTVGGKVIDLHRTLLHAPLTSIPVALFVGTYFGPVWMTLFMLGVLGHFVHYSMGMGYGVRWLWPFSTRWYKLFSSKDGEIHYDLDHRFVSWSDGEMNKAAEGSRYTHSSTDSHPSFRLKSSLPVSAQADRGSYGHPRTRIEKKKHLYRPYRHDERAIILQSQHRHDEPQRRSGCSYPGLSAAAR